LAPWMWDARWTIERYAPDSYPRFLAARQQKELFDFTWLNMVHIPIFAFSTAALPVLVWLAGTRDRRPVARLALFVLFALLGNMRHVRVAARSLSKPSGTACTSRYRDRHPRLAARSCRTHSSYTKVNRSSVPLGLETRSLRSTSSGPLQRLPLAGAEHGGQRRVCAEHRTRLVEGAKDLRLCGARRQIRPLGKVGHKA
jgi:hypothetical protein